MDFSGKYAVVTGGASGIGRATVQGLRARGAEVMIGDIDEERGRCVAQESGAKFHPLDLCQAASVGKFAQALREEFSRIDILVNGAGWQRVEYFVDNTPEFWERLLGVNLLGPVRLTQALLPRMIEAGAGKIVNVSSDAGRVGSQGEAFYSATKGGLIAFTKGLAREMARHNIHVKCICPGATDTPLYAMAPEKLRSALHKAIPFKRIAEPREIADAILFFASSQSSYITGQVLSVSGGLTMAG